MRKGTELILSDERITEAYDIGKQRHLCARKNGVYDNQQSGSSWYLVDGEGVCGEMAFAQMVNAPDSEWERIRKVYTLSSENGTDLGDCLYKGLNVDVKTTKYNSGHLIITTSKLHNLADAYALMTGFNGHYIFRGAISKQRIKGGMSKFSLHDNGSIWIHQDHLKSLVAE